tara:strand:+ start:392 stop:502 length:111 start_codon:yes stop_codon:yes gene_type:complete
VTTIGCSVTGDGVIGIGVEGTLTGVPVTVNAGVRGI